MTTRTAAGLAGRALFYERFADEFDSEMNRYEVEKRLRLVFEDALADLDLRGVKFLDAGCGTGLFSAEAARRGADVTSLDVGERLLSRVAEKCDSQRVIGDLAALPFPDEGFDVVLSTEVIEHLDQPVDGVRELARVLRPGGRLVLTTPNRVWRPMLSLAMALRMRPYEGLENWVRFRELRAWLEALDIDVKRIEGFNAMPFIHAALYEANDRLDRLGSGPAGRFMINMLAVGQRRLG